MYNTHKWKFLESIDAKIGHFSESSTKEHKYSENAEMLGVLETVIVRILTSKWFYFLWDI